MSKRGPLDAFFKPVATSNKKAKALGDAKLTKDSSKPADPNSNRQDDVKSRISEQNDQQTAVPARQQPRDASLQQAAAGSDKQQAATAQQVPEAPQATAGAAAGTNAFGALMAAASSKKQTSSNQMSSEEMQQQADRNQAAAAAVVQEAAATQQQLQLRSLLVEPSWLQVLQAEFDKPYMEQLQGFLQQEWQSHTIYPPKDGIFRAFNAVPFDQVRVVILGQDPYINQGEAMGLCFSVPPGIRVPPSLVNIYKELAQDVGAKMPKHGCLQKWCSQGVLLLNAALTVRAKNSNSHAGKGWESFTSAALTALAKQRSGLVFLLWGKYAQDRCAKLDMRKHHVLKSVHPSPLSAHRGFLGCRHFSAANKLLVQSGQPPIDWQIDEAGT